MFSAPLRRGPHVPEALGVTMESRHLPLPNRAQDTTLNRLASSRWERTLWSTRPNFPSQNLIGSTNREAIAIANQGGKQKLFSLAGANRALFPLLRRATKPRTCPGARSFWEAHFAQSPTSPLIGPRRPCLTLPLSMRPQCRDETPGTGHNRIPDWAVS